MDYRMTAVKDYAEENFYKCLAKLSPSQKDDVKKYMDSVIKAMSLRGRSVGISKTNFGDRSAAELIAKTIIFTSSAKPPRAIKFPAECADTMDLLSEMLVESAENP